MKNKTQLIVCLYGIIIICGYIWMNYKNKQTIEKMGKQYKKMENELNSVKLNINEQYTKIENELNSVKLNMNEHAMEIKNIQEIILKTNNKLNKETAFKYAKHIVNVSERYTSVSPSLLTSLIHQESRFNTLAQSSVGAKGLGQIFPETGIWISKEFGLVYSDSLMYSPKTNIEMTAWYLDYLYNNSKLCNNDIEITLAYYNGGGRQAYRYILYRKASKGGALTDKEKYNMKRLADETKDYVKLVINKEIKFKELINKS
jgi:soluble lytic murein transglycosylase-like protein